MSDNIFPTIVIAKRNNTFNQNKVEIAIQSFSFVIIESMITCSPPLMRPVSHCSRTIGRSRILHKNLCLLLQYYNHLINENRSTKF